MGPVRFYGFSLHLFPLWGIDAVDGGEETPLAPGMFYGLSAARRRGMARVVPARRSAPGMVCKDPARRAKAEDIAAMSEKERDLMHHLAE